MSGAYTTDAGLKSALTRFAAAAATLAGRCEPPQDLLQLLAEQPEWRVFVDGSKNLGHQASTVLLLRRLIDLTSFAGRVVVVWADHGRAALGRTDEKLALLWPGLDATRLDRTRSSYRSCRDIRFMPLAEAFALRETVVFGFTGGADDLDFNGAAALNVCYFMRLQPYRWDDPPERRAMPYFQCSRIEQPDGRHLYPLEGCAALRRMPLRLASPTANGDALPPGAGTSLWRLHERVDALWWPIYGLQHLADAAPHIMLTCTLLAMAHAHRTGRPVVLCAFSPSGSSTRSTALLEHLAAKGTVVPLGSALRRWRDAHAPGVTVAVHEAASDPHALAELEQALQDPRSVQIVDVGPVPMDIFHRFLAAADLPCVIEGQATANWLVGLGRPFLQLVRADASWLDDTEEAVPGGLGDAGRTIGALRYAGDGVDGPTLEALARLSAALGGAPSQSGSGTDDRVIEANGPINDKLALMLIALREVMLSTQESEDG